MKQNHSKELLHELCELGSHAPSGGNIQPWHVDAFPDYLEISLEKQRSNTILDYQHYASIFSLGSFVENVTIALQHKKIPYRVEVMPLPFHSRIYLHVESAHTEIDTHELFPFITRRMTNRKMSDGKLLSNEHIAILLELVKPCKWASLLFVHSEDDKKTVANLLGKSDVIRTMNDALFTQMLHELRFTQSSIEESCDGMDVKTLELPGNIIKMLQLMSHHPRVRQMIPRKAFEDMVKPLLRSSSHIACLCISEPIESTHLFELGRIMQRIWLRCTQLGIHVHPWSVQTFFTFRANDPADTVFSSQEQQEIHLIDQELRKLFTIPKTHMPLFIFRLFTGDNSPYKSLRLPVSSFTTFHLP